MKPITTFFHMRFGRSGLLVSGRVAILAGLSVVPFLSAGPAAAQRLPIFDAHIHYGRDAWDRLPPAGALKILKRGGVIRAFVSSTPDDGTLRLHRAAANVVVPVLRPYRTPADMATWFRDPEIPAYLEERIRTGRGVYRGIGEFHMGAGDAASPVFRRIVDLAARENLFLHAHVDAAAVAEIAAMKRGVCVLWAHAGMTAGPETIGQLLDRHANLWAELALRWDVSHDGLKPDWRKLFLRHPDRFLVGTDTWADDRWAFLPRTLDGHRAWLKELPRSVAEKIAYRNAERLAKPGACARPQAAGRPGEGSG